jgi:hypothetical protein
MSSSRGDFNAALRVLKSEATPFSHHGAPTTIQTVLEEPVVGIQW